MWVQVLAKRWDQATFLSFGMTVTLDLSRFTRWASLSGISTSANRAAIAVAERIL